MAGGVYTSMVRWGVREQAGEGVLRQQRANPTNAKSFVTKVRSAFAQLNFAPAYA